MVKSQSNSVYYVVTTAAPNEQRKARRRRTRLRTGKILDAGSPSTVDCQIFDSSKTGARLRLFMNVRLPLRIMLFDEVSEKLTPAKIMWRREREIGVAFLPFTRPREVTGTQIIRLRTGYNSAMN
jgi:hypothetical protein